MVAEGGRAVAIKGVVFYYYVGAGGAVVLVAHLFAVSVNRAVAAEGLIELDKFGVAIGVFAPKYPAVENAVFYPYEPGRINGGYFDAIMNSLIMQMRGIMK